MTAAAVDGGGGCGTVLVNMCCTGHMLIHTGAHLSDQWIQPRMDEWMDGQFNELDNIHQCTDDDYHDGGDDSHQEPLLSSNS